MFTEIFELSATAQFHLAQPLARARLDYLTHCAQQGFRSATLRKTAQFLLVIIKYLDLQEEGDISIEQIKAAADRWATRKPRHHKTKSPTGPRQSFASIALRWLRFLGRLRAPLIQQHPCTNLINTYVEHMERDKGLSLATIKLESYYVKDFLHRFCNPPRSLRSLSVADLDEAFLEKSRGGYTRTSLCVFSKSLRAFFRYAEGEGWCKTGLAEAIVSPREYKYESLPAGPSWNDVARLLASANGNSPTDIRDRAILMLLIIYGLRSLELRRLRLEDIDWEHEQIRVTRFKSRCVQVYPLSYNVGETILSYLKEARPLSQYREVFLTRRAPIQPLSGSGLMNLVARRMQKLGILPKHPGPHSLRHACATHLLTQGLSIKEIGDHLGHRHPDSTLTYAKVDIAALRRVADFDLEVLL